MKASRKQNKTKIKRGAFRQLQKTFYFVFTIYLSKNNCFVVLETARLKGGRREGEKKAKR